MFYTGKLWVLHGLTMFLGKSQVGYLTLPIFFLLSAKYTDQQLMARYLILAMYYDKYCCKKFGWLGGHFTYRQDGEMDHVYWINHGNMVIYGDIWWYMVIYGDIWWYMVIYGDIWWYMVIYCDIGQAWYGSFWKSDSPKAIVWGEGDFTRHRDGIILRNFLATLMGKSCNIYLFEHITYLNQYMDSSPQ